MPELECRHRVTFGDTCCNQRGNIIENRHVTAIGLLDVLLCVYAYHTPLMYYYTTTAVDFIRLHCHEAGQ